MCGVIATAVAIASPLSWGPILKLSDVYTNDRCIVYSYFEDQGMGHGETVETWKNIWARAGWKPVVLSEKHAALHKDYQVMRDRFLTWPTTNPAGYELACYLRYLAVSVVGGGYMTDYDTINVNVPPPPGCGYLPNEGRLTAHDDTVPAMVTGTEEEFERVIQEMFAVDINVVMAAIGESMVSDMYILEYLHQQGSVQVTHNFYTPPNWVSDPPCDENGDELPLLFHFSTDTTVHEFGTTDKSSVMNEWFERLDESRKKCTPVSAASEEEYAGRFLKPLGQNRFEDALITHRNCALGLIRCDDEAAMAESEALLSRARDANGNPISQTRLGESRARGRAFGKGRSHTHDARGTPI